MSKLVKTYNLIVNIILVLLVLLGILVIFSFAPFPGNYKIFTVQSGSMEPTIRTGSLIFVKSAGDYQTGEIVTRKTTDPKVTITHRLFSKKETDGKVAYEAKGDANDSPDAEKFGLKDIIGKVFLSIPYLGYPVGYAKTTPGLIILIVIPAVIIIYDEMNKIKEEIRKKIDYRRRVKKRTENKEENKEEKNQE